MQTSTIWGFGAEKLILIHFTLLFMHHSSSAYAEPAAGTRAVRGSARALAPAAVTARARVPSCHPIICACAFLMFNFGQKRFKIGSEGAGPRPAAIFGTLGLHVARAHRAAHAHRRCTPF